MEKKINDLISKMTIDEKIGLLPSRGNAIPRLGIKEFWIGGEAAHGLAWRGKATVFPQTIGLSSTFDVELMRKIGEVVSDEARAYFYMQGKKGGLVLFAPTVDMERDPRWGRTEEGYGEDPFLTGEMAGAYIRGMQGDDDFYLKTAMTPKHFFANNNENERAYFSATIFPRDMYEYYLDVFRRVIKRAKAQCIMTAYNEVNGVPCILNPIVKELVKEKWGLEGLVVTDGGDFVQTVTMHKTFENHYESITFALKAGIDCFLDDPEIVKKSAKEALEKGLITEEDINRAVRNILKVRFRLGEFADKDIYFVPHTKICDKEHSNLAYIASLKSVVLLKNEDKFLPLKKENLGRIAVIGSLSDKNYNDWYSGTYPYKISVLQGLVNKLYDKEIYFDDSLDKVAIKCVKNGKYLRVVETEKSPVWGISDHVSINETFKLIDWGWGNKSLQSLANKKYLTTNDETFAIFSASEEVFGWFVKELFHINSLEDGTYSISTWNNKYLYLDEREGNTLKFKDDFENLPEEKFIIEKIEDGIERACNVAQKCDLVIICVGNNPLVNGREEVDRLDITLPEHEEKLIKEIYKVNPKIVLIIISSYPYAINWEKENIKAILWTSHGGQEMGNAVSDILLGNYSPSGRLSLTWYKSSSDLPPITDYDLIKGKRTYMYFDKEPLFPFGHGLTYTEFSYKNLSLNSEKFNLGDEIEVKFEVENVGDMDSEEVVQVYIKALQSKVRRPNLQLKGFKRIFIPKGEKVEVEVKIPIEELFIWDVRRERYLIEKGFYEIIVGSSSQDIKLKGKIYVEGEEIENRNPFEIIKAINSDDYNNIVLKTKRNFKDTYVKFIDENSWILFKDLDFKRPSNKVEMEILSENSGKIILYFDKIDKELSFKISDTQKEWKSFIFDLPEISGMQNIYIKGEGVSINFFRFI